MKILITGGTTFVSRYAAEHFVSKGNEVFVLNRNSRPQSQGVHLINCDKLNLGNKFADEHFNLILDITAYTDEHIKALLNSGVSFDDYIFISSSAVYPETNPKPFTENQTCGKNSVWGDYGINKLIMSQTRIFFVRRIFTVCMKIYTEKLFRLIVLF
jgi:nucleoside-diphosphate-sugar epimerase